MRYLQSFCLICAVGIAYGSSAAAAPPDAVAHEFFEKQVRPLLAAKCQGCHGEKKQHGGLQLTSRDALLKGGETGPALVPGQPAHSLLMAVVGYRDEIKMPPDGKLAEGEIEILRRWVAAGAPWPALSASPVAKSAAGFQITPAQRNWWAFQPVRLPSVPAPAGGQISEIDAFVREALAKQGLVPAPPADRRTWLRRATFDLTGLPPTPEELSAFLADDRPQAADVVLDRLLASPAYGERWARRWLDLVRYADYYDPNPKTRVASCEVTEAWRYRDWVVAAFNRDFPFNQFVLHQIAGDLLPNPDGGEIYPAGLIATAFLVNGAWDRGDADKEKMVSDMVDDNIDTLGKAFLGLTLGCARCHDHKYDPLSTEDYYGLAGMFYSTHILENLGTKGGEYTLNRVPLVPRQEVLQREAHVARLAVLQSKLTALDKLAPPVAANHPLRTVLLQERDVLQKSLLPPPPLAIAAQEYGIPGGLFPNLQDVPIHIRGSYTRLGPKVPRRLPQFFAGTAQPKITQGSGRRELAAWVASPHNPLTARVIVNRVWQGHFGAGIVRTPSNFGLLSEPPSHPALLDWLTHQFLAEGWSLKKLHRRMMLSATYRQTSQVSREQVDRDPENRWLGRFSPRRLDAEEIRDALLAVSGELDRAGGGPAGDNIHIFKRSLYVQTARWERGNFAMLFDAANPDASTEQRTSSTVAPQSLFFLNHKFMLDRAAALAQRLAREVPGDDTARIQRASQLLFGRATTPEELAVARQVLSSLGHGDSAAGWKDLAHVLLCSNGFIYVD